VSQPTDLDQLRQRVITLTQGAEKAAQQLAVATAKAAAATKALEDEFCPEDQAAAMEAQLETDLAAELQRVEQALEEAGG
jgi:hypothetical protein